MIRLTKACHFLFISVTYQSKISPGGAEDSSARVAGTRLRLYRALVDIDNTENPEDELPTPKSLGERSV